MTTQYSHVVSSLLPDKRSAATRLFKSIRGVDRRLPDYTALVWNVVLIPVLFLYRHISVRPVLALFLGLAVLGLASSWLTGKLITHEAASPAPSHQTEVLRLLSREH